MPQTPAAAWLSVVQLLQKLSGPPHTQMQAALALGNQLESLDQTTRHLSRATWKHLIRELKVCQFVKAVTRCWGKIGGHTWHGEGARSAGSEGGTRHMGVSTWIPPWL